MKIASSSHGNSLIRLQSGLTTGMSINSSDLRELSTFCLCSLLLFAMSHFENKSGKSFLGFVLLILFSKLTAIRSQPFSNGDCLSHEALNVFRHSPGGYDAASPTVELDEKTCTTLCKEFDYSLAGVVNKRFCLCGASWDPPAPITKVDGSLCDTEDGYVRFYRGMTNPPIEGLKITSSTTRANVDETISFEVAFDKDGGEVELIIDFGDGTPPANWTDKTKAEHIFRLPGKYRVKVHARQPKFSDRLLAAASTMVAIIEKFEERDVDFGCFNLIEPGEPPGCNVTIFSGQDVSIEMNFGDESPALAFNTSGE